MSDVEVKSEVSLIYVNFMMLTLHSDLDKDVDDGT
jgi:hypothetical protein